MGSRPPALVLEGVSKRFGRGPRSVLALDGVSLSLEGGRAVALLGENGAGKSTLLRIAAGLVLPGAGRVRVGGRNLLEAPGELQRRIGWCSADERSFYPRLSCAENLRLFAALHGLPPREAAERIRELAERFGLEESLARPFQSCSTGQRQRLGLARAFLHEPDLLLLDEPARSLDASARAALAGALRGAVASEDRLAIVAGHDFAGLEGAFDEVAVLRGGKLERRGPAEPAALPRRADTTSAPRPADGRPLPRGRPRALLAALALMRRDRLVYLSYRFQTALKVALLATWIGTLYFVARLVDAGSAGVERPFAGDYFTYALLGLLGLRVSQVCLVQMAAQLREEQIQGTVEPLFATGQPPLLLLLGSLLWPLVSDCLGLLLVFGAAALLLGADLSAANVPALALAGLATLLASGVWGILSSAFVLAFQRGDPVTLLVNLVTIGLSGVFFPVEMIPGWLRPLSRILPLTWGLEAVRAAALSGEGLGSPRYPRALAGLLLLVALLAPVAVWAHSRAVLRARREGTLGQS